MIKVGIIGVTGYVGIELIRILIGHPQVKIVYVASRSDSGRPLSTVYPHLQTMVDIDCESLDMNEIAQRCDVVFTALPHGIAMNLAKPILEAGKKLIDLGADFRLKAPADYEKAYGKPAAPVEILQAATYGLPEWVPHERIREAQLIANPGCYPTCITLGAGPVISDGLVNLDRMIFDAKSGVSGAGRTLALQSHFCEVAENFKAYAIAGTHRHTPEIEQMLGSIADSSVTVQFSPHLLPMIRGMLVTSYFELCTDIALEGIWEIYHEKYKKHPFIRLCPIGMIPQTAHVRGSNYCDIGLAMDTRTRSLTVVSVIDNLVKGAAGQAVQNMNILYELSETMGLSQLCPTYP